MRIALYTSNRTTIPPAPNVVAASASLTALLAEKLVEKKHEVTLYAPRGSQTSAKLVDLGLPPMELDFALQPEEWVKNVSLSMKQVYLEKLYADADKYDVIHLQTEPVYLGFPFTGLTQTPTIVTNHNVFNPEEKRIFDYYQQIPIVTISDFQRTPLPDLNYLATVYNGISSEYYPFSATAAPDDYLLFMGRLVPVKGVTEAITIAQDVKRNLIISGVGEAAFIETQVRVHLSNTIKFVGHTPRETSAWYQLFSQAKALLFPIQWEEPFGLTLIESMACGTPVIGFARGAVPEIIEDGVTGFIVNPGDDDIRGKYTITQTGLAGFCEAVERLYSLSASEYAAMRQACRARVEAQFTVDKMVEGYERVYQQVSQTVR